MSENAELLEKMAKLWLSWSDAERESFSIEVPPVAKEVPIRLEMEPTRSQEWRSGEIYFSVLIGLSLLSGKSEGLAQFIS
jgi:hypothetical protein